MDAIPDIKGVPCEKAGKDGKTDLIPFPSTPLATPSQGAWREQKALQIKNKHTSRLFEMDFLLE